ncbi:MAG: hypothetical protein QOD26_1778 [Betaproteobacteria bacterium]|nr:hypothetical protein [Betaproteobacteria bacterium]
MLHEFLSSNRDELINRCRSKVSKRDSPPVTASELEHGVPLFLDQLVETLRCEQETAAPKNDRIRVASIRTEASTENRRTAALHGKELLDEGYTVEQVVHDYGDICQAVTELATETSVSVSVDEFRTFNRLLDNAIAEAVSSYGRHRDASASARGDLDLHERMGILADEQRRLLATALKALEALKVGNIGLRGATGTLLEDNLVALRDLIDKSLPELRLSTGMTTPKR